MSERSEFRMSRIGQALRAAGRASVVAGSAGSALLTVHTIINLRLLRRPAPGPAGPISERVSVLLPVRNEAHRVGPCLTSLRAQDGLSDAEILVLDDNSTDGTGALLAVAATHDPRLRPLHGRPLPAGWLGKPYACHQLAQAARGSVLVFVDADVRFEPHAIAGAVALLREHGLSLVSPYPRQVAITPAERVIQPLLQWSWLTTLPLRIAERSPRTSLAAANGQFMVVDARAYHRAGGHAAIRSEVLDDLALLRRIKAIGGAGGVADGTALATCRMYDGWPALRDGYRKSLWSAFGPPPSAAAALATLGLCYVVPALAALTGSRTGLAGYLCGVAGRYLTARRTGSRTLPDILTHPAAILALGWLTASSHRQRRAGQLHWSGRPVATPSAIKTATAAKTVEPVAPEGDS